MPHTLNRTFKDKNMRLQAQAEHMRKVRAAQPKEPHQASAWSKLLPRHRLFLYHYLQSWNATEAAIKAGYSKHSAHTTGHYILKAPKVAAALKERLQQQQLGADAVLARVAEIANANLLKYIDANGKVNYPELQKVGHLVKEFDVDAKAGRTHVRLHDQLAALIVLGKHHNLFVERQEVTGEAGGPIMHSVHLTAEQMKAVSPKQVT